MHLNGNKGIFMIIIKQTIRGKLFFSIKRHKLREYMRIKNKIVYKYFSGANI